MNLIEHYHSEFEQYKQTLLTQCLSLSALYQNAVLHYFQCYFEREFDDISFCIEIGKKPLLLVLITNQADGIFSYFNLPIKLIWANDISELAKKGALKRATSHLQQLQQSNITRLFYQEEINGPLSDFAVQLLKNKAAISYPLFQKVDLRLAEEELFSQVRKVFRANIRWGQQQLIYRLINVDSIENDDIEAFRQLHINVSGRETRNSASWHAQELMIRAGQAFAIYGYLDSQLVSAGLFVYNQWECYYGVGAYQRELFSQPLSHASVWQAILEAKRLGCQFFTFGEIIFSTYELKQDNLNAKKEQSISHFKQGFGGDIYPILSLNA